MGVLSSCANHFLPPPTSFHCRLEALQWIASHSQPQGNGENIKAFWAKWSGAVTGCGWDLGVAPAIQAESPGVQPPGTQEKGMELLCSSHLPCNCVSWPSAPNNMERRSVCKTWLCGYLCSERQSPFVFPPVLNLVPVTCCLLFCRNFF